MGHNTKSTLFKIILITLNLIPAHSMSLSKDAWSDGDPAPGRSPGPPEIQEETIFNTSTTASSPEFGFDKELDKISGYNNLTKNSLTSDLRHDVKNSDDPCEYVVAGGDYDITDYSDVNITFNHSVFDTTELVRGVTYEVLINFKEPEHIRDYAIMSLINVQHRGQFTPTHGTRACKQPDAEVENNKYSYNASDVRMKFNSDGMVPFLVDGEFTNSGDLVISKHYLTKKIKYKGLIKLSAPILVGELTTGRTVVLKWAVSDSKLYESVSTNVTFRLLYRGKGSSTVNKVDVQKLLRLECDLAVRLQRAGRVTSSQLPIGNTCRLQFPKPQTHYSLLIHLSKFNVPCRSGGFIKLATNAPQICGKLEELPENDSKHIYTSNYITPYVHIYGKPSFILKFKFVDFCHYLSFYDRNGSFSIPPSKILNCLYNIHLPYGYKILLKLEMGYKIIQTNTTRNELKNFRCDGMEIKIKDGGEIWQHCSTKGDPLKSVQIMSKNNNITIDVNVDSFGENDISYYLNVWWSYEAISRLVGECDFGWLYMNNVCVAGFRDSKRQWRQAEAECMRFGGHLIAISNDIQQRFINDMLFHSPGRGADEVYWIGATDFVNEGEFRWSDGTPFIYTHWYSNGLTKLRSQPNDDGMSRQDCVELRRHFPPRQPINTFMWNDRSCQEHNYYICEKPLTKDLNAGMIPACNKTVYLSHIHTISSISSPNYPHNYPDNVVCIINIIASSLNNVIVEFEELIMENEPHYDYLEIVEMPEQNSTNNESHWSHENSHESKAFEQLLEHSNFENEVYDENDDIISHTNEISSGYTRNFSLGLHVKRLCGDWSDRLKLLTYKSKSTKVQLRFVSDYSHHYSGFKAKVSLNNEAFCSDSRLKLYKNNCYLLVGYPKVSWQTASQVCEGIGAHLASIHTSEEHSFLGNLIRSNPEYNAETIYWIGSKAVQQPDRNLLSYHLWTDGSMFDYEAWLTTDIINETDACLSFQWKTVSEQQLNGFYFTSSKCEKIGGYVCKKQLNPPNLKQHLNKTIHDNEGMITSNNYPNKYDNNIDYWIKLIGPVNTRIIVTLEDIDMEFQKDCLYDYLELHDINKSISVKRCGSTTVNSKWVSSENEVYLHVHSDYSNNGRGFKLHWKSVHILGCPQQVLTSKEGVICSPNYPEWLLPNLDCTWNINAPIGKRIFLNISYFDLGSGLFNNTTEALHKTSVLKINLGGDSKSIEPYTSNELLSDGLYVSYGERLTIRLTTTNYTVGAGFYASFKTVSAVDEFNWINIPTKGGSIRHTNWPARKISGPHEFRLRTWIRAKPSNTLSMSFKGLIHANDDVDLMAPCGEQNGWIEVKDYYSDVNGTLWILCDTKQDVTFQIDSYLHTLILTQYSGLTGINMDITVRTHEDPVYLSKLIQMSDYVGPEFCFPNPCMNNGVCIAETVRNHCRCASHYSGALCSVNGCDRTPCVQGTCSLSEHGDTTCSCATGWGGDRCERKLKPCESKPCKGRGACLDRGDTFVCKCNPTWKGERCDIRDMTIRYKPLSERMLQEPFWLGLITVFIVMGVIGLVWCAKRHFPEKLEKLLAEEANRCTTRTPERRRLGGAAGGVSREMPTSTSRSLLTRLTRSKPSVYTTPNTIHAPHAARTFSLDDLLRLPRRTPSPRKKRNNSTPSKKYTIDRRQILQQLISPIDGQNRSHSPPPPKRTLAGAGSAPSVCASSEINPHPMDPRLEKKVTFARLLSRVSAEMSPGSDKEGRRSPKAASTPPSPGDDNRPTNTSLDFQSTALRRQQRSPKISSADSIFAMLRTFSTAGNSRASSTGVSVSNSPTVSSPQDEIGFDDDSFASSSCAHSIQTFESPAIGGPIEVEVVEPGRGNSSGGDLQHPPSILLEVPTVSGKCLSPIKELPTPLPSPALTPIMPRARVASVVSAESGAVDEVSIELPDDDTEFSRSESAASSVVKMRPSALSSLSAETSRWTTSPLSPAPPNITLQRPSPGSPPPRPRRSLPHIDGPPLITVTYGEPESDEVQSPIPPPNMCYLSPFSVAGRANRAPSESNLSSSGYSSMASPGPSRCGSSNPLCPSEAEDPGGGGSRTTPPHRRRRLLAKTDSAPTSGTSLDEEALSDRGRSNSETLSDDHDGMGTDRRSSDSGLTTVVEIVGSATPPHIVEKLETETNMASLYLPAIVIGSDSEKPLSPTSSRSESPTSDRVGIGRFSPQFYRSNKDQLPFTDSDGIYDFPSSECVPTGSTESALIPRRSSVRKRRSPRSLVGFTKSAASPPTRLVVPAKELRELRIQRKTCARKRSRVSRPVSTSSSSESIHSTKSAQSPRSPRSPPRTAASARDLTSLTDEVNKQRPSPIHFKKPKRRRSKTQEDISSRNLSNGEPVDYIVHTRSKIGRLRSISNQIRFLKRLEQSLKCRERYMAPSDDEGGESSSVTSPLLNNKSQDERTNIHKATSLESSITTPLLFKTISLPSYITSPNRDNSFNSIKR